jgi:hypothetical protein
MWRRVRGRLRLAGALLIGIFIWPEDTKNALQYALFL